MHSLAPPPPPPTLPRHLRTTCRLPCFPTIRIERKITDLHQRAHLERLSQSLEPIEVNLARLRYPPHLPKTRTNPRSGGQASHNLTPSRTTMSQTSRPRPRDHRANRNNLNNRSSRRHYSKLRTDISHPHVRLPPRSNLKFSRLRSSVLPRVRDNHRSFSSPSSRFSHSFSHHSSVSNHSNPNTNNHYNHNTNSHPLRNNSRCRERTHLRIWPGCSNISPLLCLAFGGIM